MYVDIYLLYTSCCQTKFDTKNKAIFILANLAKLLLKLISLNLFFFYQQLKLILTISYLTYFYLLGFKICKTLQTACIYRLSQNSIYKLEGQVEYTLQQAVFCLGSLSIYQSKIHDASLQSEHGLMFINLTIMKAFKQNF